MTQIIYIVQPSFSKPIWCSVERWKGKLRMQRSEISCETDGFLTSLKFDYPKFQKYDVPISELEYDNLLKIVNELKVSLNNDNDVVVGCDGTSRQLTVINGFRIIGIRWWEDDLGDWEALSRIQNWFTNKSVV